MVGTVGIWAVTAPGSACNIVHRPGKQMVMRIEYSSPFDDILVADNTEVPGTSPLGGWGSVQAHTERVIRLEE